MNKVYDKGFLCYNARMAEQKTTRLYRVENPNTEVNPERFGDTSHPELIGQWFTPDFDQATGMYLQKSTRPRGESRQPQVVNGAQILVADIPDDELPKYLVSTDARTEGIDIEGDNYLLPRDGTVRIEQVSLDGLLGEIYDKIEFGLGKNLTEARRRIAEAVANITVNS